MRRCCDPRRNGPRNLSHQAFLDAERKLSHIQDELKLRITNKRLADAFLKRHDAPPVAPVAPVATVAPVDPTSTASPNPPNSTEEHVVEADMPDPYEKASKELGVRMIVYEVAMHRDEGDSQFHALTSCSAISPLS